MHGPLHCGDQILLEYEVLDLAGVGATSFVYRCRPRDPALPDVVAVKVLHTRFVYNADTRAQFLAEIELIKSLSHENVVTVYDVIDLPGQLAFVMEHVDGPTLQDWHASRAGTPSSDTELCEIFVGVLQGLAHAHDRGVIHRDLKPANILVDESGPRPVAKIIDFGVARRCADGPSEADFQSIRGTAAYMSPDEIRSPWEVCEASDLYSLGVVLYELAAGTRPFCEKTPHGLMEAHLHEDPLPPTMFNPNLSPALESVIMRSLEKKPRDRYASAQCLLSALQQATGTALTLAEQAANCDDEAPSWARRRARSIARVVNNAAKWLFNPGVTSSGADPHHLARPHVELMVV